MKKWIATMVCTAAALANAADSAQVGNCIAYASASRREQAAHDAYALADNPRVAIATAKQALANIERAKDQSTVQYLANQYASDCRKIGIRMSNYR